MKWVWGFCAGIVVLALAGAGLWLGGGVAGLVNYMDMGVRVTGLRGNVVRTLHVDTLELADPQGVWLVLEQGDLRWRPWSLWTGETLLEKVEVQRVRMVRRPAYPVGEPEVEAAGRPLEAYLAWVPDVVRVQEFAMEAAVAGRAQRLRGELARGGAGYRAEIGTLEGPETRLVAEGNALAGGAVSGTLVLREAKDGLLARLAHEVGDVTLQGPLDIQAEVSGTRTALHGSVKVSATSFVVREFRVTPLAVTAQGRVDATRAGMPYAAQVRAAGEVKTAWGKAFTADMAVSATGAGTAGAGDISTTLVQEGRRFEAVGRGWWKDTAAGAEHMALRGPGVVVEGEGQLAFETLLTDARMHVDVTDLRPLGRMTGVSVQGTVRADIVLDAVNAVQTGTADVTALDVTYDRQRVRLRQAGRVAWDGVRGVVSPLTLEVAGGVVRVSGTLDRTRVNGGFDVQGVNVGLLSGDAVSGTVSGRGRISGAVGAPVVVWQAQTAVEVGEFPLAATLRGDWRKGVLKAEAEVATQGQTLRGNVAVQGGLSLWPLEVGLGPQSRLSGMLAGSLPLTTLNPMLWERGLQVGGNVSGSMMLGGTLGAPQPRGRAELRDGEVSHAASGMCLRDVIANVVGDVQGLRLVDLTAPDGHGGTLGGQGYVSLQGAQALEVGLQMREFRLFCGGLASGVVAGDITVQGTLPQHIVAGRVTVGPLQVQIPGRSREEDIPYVEMVRVREETPRDAVGSVTKLDVQVEAPQRVYVRGRGLDAEFGGSLRIGGTAAKPLLHGRLTALRGSYTLIDRTLQLADSVVRFEGTVPPSPFLDVKATTTVRGTALTLAITGQARTPKLALTSDPYVPQDEALALLLFGRSLSNISAFEALKLAQAARVLSGRDSGGPSLLDRARETLGVDTLDVGSGNDGGVTVTTGKYLTDGVYISVSQGAEPADRDIRTEIELTPSLNANTVVDGAGTQTFGLEWKRDY